MTAKDFIDLKEYLFSLGGWGAFLGILIYYVFFPEKAEKFTALIFKFLKLFWKGAEKKFIAHDIQGRVNDFVNNHLKKEIKGFDPPNIKLIWAEENQDRKTFLKDGKIIVRMRKSENQNENFVNATMIFISESLLVKTKRYISPRQRDSLDLFVAKKLFEKEKRELMIQFVDDYLYKGTSDTKIREYFDKYHLLETAGVFFPVFIQEMNFLGEKVFAGGKNPKIYDEVHGLVEFLNSYIGRKEGEDIETEFEGNFCKFGMMIVGKKQKIQEKGIEPYSNFIKILQTKGIETIYLFGSLSKENIIKMICSKNLLNEIGFFIFNQKKYKSKIKDNSGNIREIDTFLTVLRQTEIEHYYLES